ncbi:MAG: aldo/keto reductase [Myxococcota bacterium]
MLDMPGIMYGTAWKEEQTADLVFEALNAGFRGIDTANQRKHYHEAAVGDGLRRFLTDSRTTRDDLFIQTKFTYERGQDHRLPYDPKAPIAEQVAQSFEMSLEHLGLDRIDSLVLHGPWAPENIGKQDREAWGAMEQLVRDNKVRMLGLSNCTLQQLETLWSFARVKPSVVQNRCFARQGWDIRVRAFCALHGLAYQGFSLLTANREEGDHPLIHQIAERESCTPAQVTLKFARDVGMTVLTGTTSPEHMHHDLDLDRIELTRLELEALRGLFV